MEQEHGSAGGVLGPPACLPACHGVLNRLRWNRVAAFPLTLPSSSPLPPAADLSIRKTPGKHARMPSHEAILKVAKQHKLPAPVLTAPPQQQVEPLLPAQEVPAPKQAPQQAPQQEQQAQQRGEEKGAIAAVAPQPCLPVFRPAAPASSSAAAAAAGRPAISDAERRRVAAEAAYGERWQALKARVQLTSPHGRRPGWDLRCVIVKTGDDCRQELLAMQVGLLGRWGQGS